MSTFNTDFVMFLEDGNRYMVDSFSVNWTCDVLSNDVTLIFVAWNFIISTCLRYANNTDFVNFLKDYNRYTVGIFKVN